MKEQAYLMDSASLSFFFLNSRLLFFILRHDSNGRSVQNMVIWLTANFWVLHALIRKAIRILHRQKLVHENVPKNS